MPSLEHLGPRAVRCLPTTTELVDESDWIGHSAAVTGSWTGDAIVEARLRRVERRAPAFEQRVEGVPDFPIAADIPDGELVLSIVRDLRADETILWTEKDPDGALRVVTNDAARVRKALEPHMSRPLRLVPSRWDNGVQDSIRKVLAVAAREGVLFSSGERIDPPDAWVHTAAVTYVTPDLAGAVNESSIPSGALELEQHVTLASA